MMNRSKEHVGELQLMVTVDFGSSWHLLAVCSESSPESDVELLAVVVLVEEEVADIKSVEVSVMAVTEVVEAIVPGLGMEMSPEKPSG